MANIDRFVENMRRLGKAAQENADKLVRKTALAVDATVVLATPVDTGRARGNWQVQLNHAPAGTVATLSPTGAEALAQGQQTIAQYKGGTGQAKEVHITNNLPYIGRLNEGSSAQAPAGFVEAAINAGLQAIEGATILRSSTP